MFSCKSIVLIAVACFARAQGSGVPVAAPLIAPAFPAAVGYAHAVPQNIPPYASQINVVNKALSPLVAAPIAAPVAAPFAAPFAGPVAAPLVGPAPFASARYYAPSPFLPGPYAAAYSAPYAAPYALPAAYPGVAAPLIRAPFAAAPAYVR